MPQNNYSDSTIRHDRDEYEIPAMQAKVAMRDNEPMSEVVGRAFKSADVLSEHVNILYDRLLGGRPDSAKGANSPSGSGVYNGIIEYANEIDRRCMDAIRTIEQILNRT